jgi:hypothetical protein
MVFECVLFNAMLGFEHDSKVMDVIEAIDWYAGNVAFV